jgi:hypothetical protein
MAYIDYVESRMVLGLGEKSEERGGGGDEQAESLPN